MSTTIEMKQEEVKPEEVKPERVQPEMQFKPVMQFKPEMQSEKQLKPPVSDVKPKRSALKPKRQKRSASEDGGAEYRFETMQVRAYYPKRFACDDTDDWTKIC